VAQGVLGQTVIQTLLVRLVLTLLVAAQGAQVVLPEAVLVVQVVAQV
jgi:hypothetical protein